MQHHIMDAEILPLLRAGVSSLDLDPLTIISMNSEMQLLDTEAQTRAKEIAKIQSVLQRLQQEYENTVADLRRKQSLLSPIRRLPSDMLLHIFSLAADDIELCLSSPPFIFRSVCYTWRVLVLSSPTLWSKVNITMPKLSWDTSKAYNMRTRTPLHTAFCLSGNCPLNMSIKDSGITHETLVSMTECIAPTSDRWKSLRLHVQNSAGILRLSNISGRLPLLESLDFTFYNPPPRKHFDEALSRLFCSVPLLRTVRISGGVFCELSLPLHQLTSIHLDLEHQQSGTSLFYDCISRGKKLHSLTFYTRPYNPPDMQPLSEPLPEITRPNIRRLSLKYDIPQSLKYCTFPQMEQLTLFTGFEERESAPIISADELAVVSECLKRSTNRLRSFAVYRPMPFPAFNRIAVRFFTSLTDLDIAVNVETSTEIVQRLAESSFIPCLQHLSLHICLPIISLFEDDSLRAMAVTRHRYGLKSLALSVLSSKCLRYSGPIVFDWSRHLLNVYKLKEAGLGVTLLLDKRDFFGDDDAVDKLMTWLKNWSRPERHVNPYDLY
ncbi:hypothetical protein ARMSODRAFT_1025720 [Armillaria solidipes]|uniref:Uncharacterized protein n=1 Tax=Armillaria solidipes TaxID=1076256 RepID=A0A2H3ARK2_9AGAR|nr:hypothetical protein ARMSODRAFT_1025720 [Armillaria solidipes]